VVRLFYLRQTAFTLSGVELRFSRHSPDWRVTQNFTHQIREKLAEIMSLLSICTVCTSREKRFTERRKKALAKLASKLKKITCQFQIPLAFGELASDYFHP
jgi:hypothetical protein